MKEEFNLSKQGITIDKDNHTKWWFSEDKVREFIKLLKEDKELFDLIDTDIRELQRTKNYRYPLDEFWYKEGFWLAIRLMQGKINHLAGEELAGNHSQLGYHESNRGEGRTFHQARNGKPLEVHPAKVTTSYEGGSPAGTSDKKGCGKIIRVLDDDYNTAIICGGDLHLCPECSQEKKK